MGPAQYAAAPAYGPGFYAPPFAGGYGYGNMPPQPFSGPAFPYGPCGRGFGGGGEQKIMGFPVHPYARSPRDYFMVDLECCGTH
jgi:hypothetical protein